MYIYTVHLDALVAILAHFGESTAGLIVKQTVDKRFAKSCPLVSISSSFSIIDRHRCERDVRCDDEYQSKHRVDMISFDIFQVRVHPPLS